MLKLFAIVLSLGVTIHCQVLPREDDRSAASGAPTRYVLPYVGLGDDQEDVKEELYKPNRRSERIPQAPYQYEEAIPEEEYYRPQPRPKAEPESFSYQPSVPTHKDYEQILKTTHLARLRAASKKPPQPPHRPQHRFEQAAPHPQHQPVEQYLKEVSPTTKTSYQRPSNYLRFNEQAGLKPEQNEEIQRPVLKPPSYRYVLQPEPQQQKVYPQYQFENPESSKPPPPKGPHFNLVAYQNALLAQQKVLSGAENSREEQPPKSSIYVSQNVPKKTKTKQKTPQRQQSQHFDYYPQAQPQPQQQPPQLQEQPSYNSEPASPVRYQPRNIYQKPDYQIEDSPAYPEQKEIEQYRPQTPTRQPKQPTKSRTPARKPAKYQTEEQPEEYQIPLKEQVKYQVEDPSFEYQPAPLKYQPEEQPLNYRRPPSRQQTRPVKYQQAAIEEAQPEVKHHQIPPSDFLPYQAQLPKYQPEAIPRRQPQYQEPELRQVPGRYLPRQQYQEETRLLPQYQPADLVYQQTVEVPVRYRSSGRGPAVDYSQEVENSNVRYFRSLGRPYSYLE